jgi:hypothetical protein
MAVWHDPGGGMHGPQPPPGTHEPPEHVHDPASPGHVHGMPSFALGYTHNPLLHPPGPWHCGGLLQTIAVPMHMPPPLH